MNSGFLTEEDIYILSQYIEELDIENLCIYLNPYISIGDLNEIAIREGFFNYTILPYAHRSEYIEKLVYYRLPRPESNSRVVEIYLLTELSSTYGLEFLRESLIHLQNKKLGFSKVRVPVNENHDSSKLIKILEAAGFQHELTLEDEFVLNSKVHWYSWFLDN